MVVCVAIVAPVLFAGSQQSICSGIPMPPFTAALSGEDMNSAGAVLGGISFACTLIALAIQGLT